MKKKARTVMNNKNFLRLFGMFNPQGKEKQVLEEAEKDPKTFF